MTDPDKAADDSADFELDLDQVFHRPDSPPIPRSPRVGPVEEKLGSNQEGDPGVPELPSIGRGAVSPEESAKKSKPAKFERRSGDAAKSFTRLAARSSAAHPATGGRSVPKTPSLEELPDAAVFGKKRELQDRPELQLNKAHSVLEGVLDEEPSWWLDPHRFNRHLRWISVVVLVGLCGYLLWKFTGTASHSLLGDSSPAVPVGGQEERIDAARRTMQNYLSAKTWEEKLQYVLEPERVKEKMREYYEDLKSKDPEVDLSGIQTYAPRLIGGKYWFAFDLRTPQSNYPQPMQIQETAGGFKIDWENFVALGTMPWEHFCKERPAEAKQMRIILRVTDKFSPPYADHDKFEAYTVEHRSGPPVLIGYASKTERVSQELLKLFRKPGEAIVANVYLSFEVGAAADQVKIVDLVPDLQRY